MEQGDTRAESRSEQASLRALIYESLVGHISQGTFPDGASISEHALAAQFGVSRSPVRAALAALEEHGLVEVRSKQPTRVVPVNLETLSLLWEISTSLWQRELGIAPAPPADALAALADRLASLDEEPELIPLHSAFATAEALLSTMTSPSNSEYYRRISTWLRVQILHHARESVPTVPTLTLRMLGESLVARLNTLGASGSSSRTSEDLLEILLAQVQRGIELQPHPPTRVPRPQPTSLAEHSFLTLLAMIVSGEIAPGEPLSEQWVATTLGVSRVPAREALNRLEQWGLLTHGTGRRTQVTVPTAQEYLGAGSIVGALYERAIRNTLGQLSHAGMSTFDDLADAVERHVGDLTSSGGFDQVIKDLDAFFTFLVDAASNQSLTQLAHRTGNTMYFMGTALASAPRHDSVLLLIRELRLAYHGGELSRAIDAIRRFTSQDLSLRAEQG